MTFRSIHCHLPGHKLECFIIVLSISYEIACYLLAGCCPLCSRWYKGGARLFRLITLLANNSDWCDSVCRWLTLYLTNVYFNLKLNQVAARSSVFEKKFEVKEIVPERKGNVPKRKSSWNKRKSSRNREKVPKRKVHMKDTFPQKSFYKRKSSWIKNSFQIKKRISP